MNEKTFNPLSPHDALKHHFTSLKTYLILLLLRGFKNKIFMKLFYLYIAISSNFQPASSHLHPLQVKNCDKNSRLVVDKDDNGKLRLERVKREVIVRLNVIPIFLIYLI